MTRVSTSKAAFERSGSVERELLEEGYPDVLDRCVGQREVTWWRAISFVGC